MDKITLSEQIAAVRHCAERDHRGWPELNAALATLEALRDFRWLGRAAVLAVFSVNGIAFDSASARDSHQGADLAEAILTRGHERPRKE